MHSQVQICTHCGLLWFRNYRGKGLAKRAVKKLVDVLLSDGITTIGLNVESENEAALKLYGSLGFQKVLEFEEAVVSIKK